MALGFKANELDENVLKSLINSSLFTSQNHINDKYELFKGGMNYGIRI